MPTAYLTRIVGFTAQHALRRADLTADENEREFGAAARDHEHRYQIRVTVAGALAAERGGVVRMAELDALLREEVVQRFDGRRVNEAVAEFAAGRTCLIVAHRLGTVMGADRIVVMQKGKIVETGTHAGLLAQNGAYAQLHRSQFTLATMGSGG